MRQKTDVREGPSREDMLTCAKSGFGGYGCENCHLVKEGLCGEVRQAIVTLIKSRPEEEPPTSQIESKLDEILGLLRQAEADRHAPSPIVPAPLAPCPFTPKPTDWTWTPWVPEPCGTLLNTNGED